MHVYIGWGTKVFTAEILVMNLFSGVNMHGILSNWYPSGELMPFKGSVPFPYNKDHSKLPTITQRREAAQTGRDKQIMNLQIAQRNL